MQPANWQLLDSMLTADDSLVLYEQAWKLIVSDDAESHLLAFLSQGVKLYVIVEPVGEAISIPEELIGHVKSINWIDFVDLTVNDTGVCSI